MEDKVDFSRISVIIQSTEWQTHFSANVSVVNCHFSFFQLRRPRHELLAYDTRRSELINGLEYHKHACWFFGICSLYDCLTLFLELISLIFYNFYNHQLSSFANKFMIYSHADTSSKFSVSNNTHYISYVNYSLLNSRNLTLCLEDW